MSQYFANYWSVVVLVDGNIARCFECSADDLSALYFNIGVASGILCNRSITEQLKSEVIITLKQKVQL